MLFKLVQRTLMNNSQEEKAEQAHWISYINYRSNILQTILKRIYIHSMHVYAHAYKHATSTHVHMHTRRMRPFVASVSVRNVLRERDTSRRRQEFEHTQKTRRGKRRFRIVELKPLPNIVFKMMQRDRDQKFILGGCYHFSIIHRH